MTCQIVARVSTRCRAPINANNKPKLRLPFRTASILILSERGSVADDPSNEDMLSLSLSSSSPAIINLGFFFNDPSSNSYHKAQNYN